MPLIATGSQPYILTAQPTVWPITVADFKAWAKIPLSSSAEDGLIASIIKRVTEQAELYTKREFITKSFQTYRDIFGDEGENPAYEGYLASNYALSLCLPFTLRRSKLQAITSIKYYSGGIQVTLDPASYYIVHKEAFSMVASVNNAPWPLVDDRMQAVEIIFTAGYGASADAVPAAIKGALLAHANQVYANRGDCDIESGAGAAACSCSLAPSSAKSVYNQYRIIDFVG